MVVAGACLLCGSIEALFIFTLRVGSVEARTVSYFLFFISLLPKTRQQIKPFTEPPRFLTIKG
jgi:hypothetical protein